MLPNKLKDFMVFNEGNNYRGQVATVTLPKLARKIDRWRGAGMDGGFPVDMGAEDMDMEHEYGGPMRDIFAQFGAVGSAGNMIRFAGAYQADDTGDVVQLEVTIRGKHEEIEQGEQKLGEGGSFKVKTALHYYRLDWNGTTLIEIDILAGTFVVDGVDRRAAITAALGI